MSGWQKINKKIYLFQKLIKFIKKNSRCSAFYGIWDDLGYVLSLARDWEENRFSMHNLFERFYQRKAHWAKIQIINFTKVIDTFQFRLF